MVLEEGLEEHQELDSRSLVVVGRGRLVELSGRRQEKPRQDYCRSAEKPNLLAAKHSTKILFKIV